MRTIEASFGVLAVGLCIAAAAIAGGSGATGRVGAGAAGLRASVAAAPGHPTPADLAGAQPRGGEGLPDPDLAPDDPPDSPLVKGAFVNFESPAVKPVVVNAAGDRVFVANTPNNTVVVFDTSGDAPVVIEEIPVGLDPVALALRPGAGDAELWVANRLSDNVNVIDLSLGRIVAVIPVGDEPGTIVFDDEGAYAFVVTEGPPLPEAGDPIREQSGLVSINAATKRVAGRHVLDLNAARGAVYDSATNTVIVAALLSGNNTTIAGAPVVVDVFDDPDDPGAGVSTVLAVNLLIPQVFSLTAPIFTAGQASGLGAWPDPSAVPEEGAPQTLRIVPDAGSGGAGGDNAWRDIVEAISDGAGGPDPAVVAQFEAEFPIVANAAEVFAEIINDVKDVADHDLEIVDVSDPAAMSRVKVIGGAGTTLTDLALDQRTGDLYIAAMEARNVDRLEPNIRGVFMDHVLTAVRGAQSGAPVVERYDLNADVPGFSNPSAFNAEAHVLAVSNPIAVAVTGDGRHALTLALGADRLAAVETGTGRVAGRVDVGRGPRGLAIDDDRGRAYVLNRTDHSLSVVNIANPAGMEVIATAPIFNPEPADVRDGRDFLYSTRFSNLNRTSCASCHIDARLDGLAWDLGDHQKQTLNETPHIPADLFSDPCAQGNGENHPVKGPMVTQSLQGLSGHEPLHWRGDRPLFEDFNPAFDGLLGGAELSDEQMLAFRRFVMSIAYPPNPHRNRDNTFKDPEAVQGRALLINACNRCHEFRHDGALTVSDECPDVPGDSAFNLSGLFAQVQLVPQLRDLRKKFNFDRYTGFGLLHDGRDEREDNPGVAENFLETFFAFNETQQARGAAFLTAWQNNVMPIVGMQTLAEAQAPPPSAAPDQQPPHQPANPINITAINLMIEQSALTPSRNDVVAKGKVNGEPMGYWMFSASPTPLFRSTEGTEHTLSQLLALVSDGASLVFTAVPPRSGRRIGVDQDNDCLADGLDPEPQHPRKHADLNGDNIVNSADLALLLGLWGTATPEADLDDSGAVGAGDLAAALGMWGVCP